MSPTAGPYAGTVIRWIAGEPTTDSHNNETPAFTPRSIRSLAEYPPGVGAGRGASSEADNMVTVDRVLLLDPAVAATELDEFTLSDGVRYRVQGTPGQFRSPFTGTAVTQVNLRRIT